MRICQKEHWPHSSRNRMLILLAKKESALNDPSGYFWSYENDQYNTERNFDITCQLLYQNLIPTNKIMAKQNTDNRRLVIGKL